MLHYKLLALLDTPIAVAGRLATQLGGLLWDGLHRTEHRPQSRVDTANIDTVTTQQSESGHSSGVDTIEERTVVLIPAQSTAAIAAAGLFPV